MYNENNHSESSSDSQKSELGSQQQWPIHACSYCGNRDKNCVLKCSNKNCNKWFCNDRDEQGFASHIIFHLIKAKHNEISTHPQSELEQLAIQCFMCGNTNVFVLGYVEVKDGNIFICRAPCATQNKTNEFQWNSQNWLPIIQEKQLINWIGRKSKESDKKFKIPFQEMTKLQQAWKTNPKIKPNDILKKKNYRKLKPVVLKYKSGKHYKSIFQTLLSEQSKSDKGVKQAQTQSNKKITFTHQNGKRFAYFMFGSREDNDASLVPGNELKISYKSQWNSKGVVIKITGNEQVCLELLTNDEPPKENYPYKVEFVWKATSYQRMKKGLKKFQNDHTSISSFLYHSILGQSWKKNSLQISVPNVVDTAGLPKLNCFQVDAIKRALIQPLCLIQGPPGTGKTITSACIVYHLVKRTKKKILVCAPSNVVVDMLAKTIYQTGINVLRFCSKSRESVSSEIEQLTLHYKLRNMKNSNYNKLNEYFQTVEGEKQLSIEQESKFRQMKKKAQYDILDKAEVICATCIASADRRLNQFLFYHVLIDQATQAIQPQCLLPMLKSAKQVILVGDHLQLGPVVICRDTAKAGLNKSLFQRLVRIGHKPLRLQVQYRMHPCLTSFPSNTFYDGTLQNGITQKDRVINKNFPWPKNRPCFFLNLYGTEELSASGTSYLNRTEATAVDRILFYLEKAGIGAKQIGIITPYKGQRAYIISYLQKNGQISSTNSNYYKDLEVASVDGYQGRQKDYIIVSCVRSNDGPGIGFLKDARRLNVTITRAKYGMIILGNAKVLYQDNLWNNLLNEFKKTDTLVEGTIPNFRATLLTFPPPQKYDEKKANVDNDSDDEYRIDSDNLKFLDQIPITTGYRYKQLGTTQIPSVSTFNKDRLFEIFSSEKGDSHGFEEKRANLKDLGLD